MGVLKRFVLDNGHDYRSLRPATLTHLPEDLKELHVLALNADQSVGLGFIAMEKGKSDLINLPADAKYTIEWWNVDTGGWSNVQNMTSDEKGTLVLPDPPFEKGWAYRIKGV